MKILSIIILFIVLGSFAFGQSDPILIFKLHKFPCDSSTTTLYINQCSGIKRDFADSLLNDTYQKIIKSIDRDLIEDKKNLILEQSKKDTSMGINSTIEFLKKSINTNQRLKESIVKSELEWIKMRDLNVNVVSTMSEGGTGFVSEENQSLIDDTLDRIKKLKSFHIQ